MFDYTIEPIGCPAIDCQPFLTAYIALVETNPVRRLLLLRRKMPAVWRGITRQNSEMPELAACQT
jgi:hypothetical protein